MSAIELKPMCKKDWASVSEIYADGMATGHATFEYQLPSYEAWNANHLESCRLIAYSGDKCMGWAALSPVSKRAVYRGVAEVSIYIAKDARGKGVGSRLMQSLIKESEKHGLWTLQSGIFPENTGSIHLHEKMGFRYIGKRERVGKRDGVWKDNLLFERRSTAVGND
ncbi:GNAT family N-acetyltransferase [Zobellia galactanivorans]|uniref:GCN5-related N-acetyltransferase n=1 Tax=Zobellia galactanivorans (strain DSM 12802 / CCUG 47099 / CIP 106680 / NCIMB 13871 / Dsij) TaxID=63186 RepID=G0L5H2_ZOBGA|nr:GNAT family N-acetyltransferase [Zobellia galactanivorans]CAZ96279.1 GCN5-related N-acetyltransferase [Zobellia galactanivorans]